MINTVFTETFTTPPVDIKEILRYAGTKEATPEIEALLSECLAEVQNKLSYRVCYVHLPLSFCEDAIDLSFMQVSSRSLRKNLTGCDSYILFAATVGLELDRLIAKYGRISPSKALMLQAIGAERIESLCNVFNQSVSERFGHTVPRFSPGYGDLPIEVQGDFFRVLDPGRKIGLTLNESMLMTPSKSVTAIIGISKDEQQTKKHSCSQCNKINCSFRRTK